MNPLAVLRERLQGRTDSEHDQALLRIVLVGLITAYMRGRVGALSGPLGGNDSVLLAGLVGFFVLAIGIFVAIYIWPKTNIPRRILGMLADVGFTTFALFLTGESGVWLIGVYMFITFGNGFRYGRSYLFLCLTLCLIGFSAVVVSAPWWRDRPSIGWGLMITMIVLPLYVSTLLARIHEARAKTVQALKECLERERRVG
jgi:two-component system, sensor histidine kinase RpfC